MGRANALIIRFIDTPGDFDSRRNAAVVRRQLSETALTAPSHEEARPGSWMCGFGRHVTPDLTMAVARQLLPGNPRMIFERSSEDICLEQLAISEIDQSLNVLSCAPRSSSGANNLGKRAT